jgi:hypothetical protein
LILVLGGNAAMNLIVRAIDNHPDTVMSMLRAFGDTTITIVTLLVTESKAPSTRGLPTRTHREAASLDCTAHAWVHCP